MLVNIDLPFDGCIRILYPHTYNAHVLLYSYTVYFSLINIR